MRKTLITGIMAILVASTFASTAHARFSCRTICRAFLAGVGIQKTAFRTEGVGTFDDVSSADQTPNSVLKAVEWTGTGNEPTLGNITWSFDVSRPVDFSSVKPNQADALFPATGDLYFHITGTIGINGDIKYQSTVPLHVTNANLFSFNPANGEQLTLVAPVDFEDVNRPGEVAFTLSDLVLELYPG